MRTAYREVVVAFCGMLAVAAAAPALAQGRTAGGTEARPYKIVNLKAGATLEIRDDPDSGEFCRDPVRAAGQFGLQTAFFPFTAEVTFETTVAVSLYAAGWWPFLRVGPGWLAASAGLFGRDSMVKTPNGEEGCGGPVSTGMEFDFGVGASVEYLLVDGHLGFVLDLRQTVLSSPATFVTLGVDVSPLLVLLLRRY
ncbi:MAG: hypothetical protein FJ109_06860 [Deltaproteobacteria bacterium]|nr:hypothetical protein [Deltaproteobacteria bacterium]